FEPRRKATRLCNFNGGLRVQRLARRNMCKASFWRRATTMVFVAFCTLIIPTLAKADNPIRVGLSVALTGGVAPAGKQVLAGLQIWGDDVNAKGGLLGRPIELLFHYTHHHPPNLPPLSTHPITL